MTTLPEFCGTAGVAICGYRSKVSKAKPNYNYIQIISKVDDFQLKSIVPHKVRVTKAIQLIPELLGGATCKCLIQNIIQECSTSTTKTTTGNDLRACVSGLEYSSDVHDVLRILKSRTFHCCDVLQRKVCDFFDLWRIVHIKVIFPSRSKSHYTS